MYHVASLPAVSDRIEDLLPHADPMLLLDRIVGADLDECLTETVIGRRHALFLRDDRTVTNTLLIELMAQTVGVTAGLRLKAKGEPPKVGFLLGSRHFACRCDCLNEGEQIRVHVKCLYFSDGELPSQFQCSAYRNDETEPVGTANLTVYQPKDLSAWNNSAS